MNYERVKNFSYAVVIFIVVSSMSLWAWNTLSALFSFPTAQYKHIVAAMVLAFIARWIISGHKQTRRQHRECGHNLCNE